MILCYRRLVSLILCLFGRRRNPSVVRTTPTRSRLPRPSVSPASGEDKPKDPHQRCVVCRDRQKCVLLLPCKHLCLCEDCADYILFTGQQQKCPLCRTNIVHSMSVYTWQEALLCESQKLRIFIFTNIFYILIVHKLCHKILYKYIL